MRCVPTKAIYNNKALISWLNYPRIRDQHQDPASWQRRRRCYLLSAVITSLGSPAWAENWPRFAISCGCKTVQITAAMRCPAIADHCPWSSARGRVHHGTLNYWIQLMDITWITLVWLGIHKYYTLVFLSSHRFLLMTDFYHFLVISSSRSIINNRHTTLLIPRGLQPCS